VSGGGKDKDVRPIVIVKRKSGGGGGHHGGAWKVAYADFVTAMMAFFMVMWLVASVSKEQRAAIFDYFKNPSMEDGRSVKPAPGQNGPGGASTSVINMGGGLNAMHSGEKDNKGLGVRKDNAATAPKTPEEIKKQAAELERKQLESLMKDLREAIASSSALAPYKDQLLLDITSEGLRIQIVDNQNRPMFDLGSTRLKDYSRDILRELATYLNSVPNRISITGHTDETPYTAQNGYNNWDLSTERANAARRAIEAGGLSEGKISRVVGLASSVLFDKDNPRNPINRRISIIVLTREAEASALKTDAPAQNAANGAEGATDAAAPEGPAAAAPGTSAPAATGAAPAPGAAPAVPVSGGGAGTPAKP